MFNNWLKTEKLLDFDKEMIKEIKRFIDWLESEPKINHSFIEHHKYLLKEIKDSI